MVRALRARGMISSPEVERAMTVVPRHLFVPPEMRALAYRDSPLPIGEGQTISAPHMVAMMAEVLELAPGLKVLEVGTGSGYNAAVMAELVGEEGMVITLERHRALAERAERALDQAGYGRVRVVVADGSLGYPPEAPYDRVSVTCGAPDVPVPLAEQLREGGIMAIPVGSLDYQKLLKASKREGRMVTEDLGAVMFVPLIGEKGYRP